MQIDILNHHFLQLLVFGMRRFFTYTVIMVSLSRHKQRDERLEIFGTVFECFYCEIISRSEGEGILLSV